MKMAAKFILIPLVLFMVLKANAKVEWNEPEVVPEKLVRKNRRVLRFSGVTNPSAQIRIRKDRLKLYLDNGKSRLAKIPQKNRVQFPVVADGDGSFTFDLYIPTVAVEIPVEVKTDNVWQPYTLNFRVPDSGAANDFQAIEESFKDQDERMERPGRDENFYSRKSDQGQLIRDRGGKIGYEKSNIIAWGGLGLSYFSTDVKDSINGSTSGSTIVLPTWRIGGEWDYSKKIRVKGGIRSTSGSTDKIGDTNTTGRDFNWFEAQIGAVYFSDALTSRLGRFGFDLGFQLQSLPLFRLRTQGATLLTNTAYFDNNTYNLHVGIQYEKDTSTWDYEGYARYLYPFSSGDAFNIESSFPLNFEFSGGIKRPLTQGLALGFYGQLNYFSMDTSYTGGGTKITSDLNLMLFTVDVRLIANF
jgi:hypothetical protein